MCMIDILGIIDSFEIQKSYLVFTCHKNNRQSAKGTKVTWSQCEKNLSEFHIHRQRSA